MLKGKTVLLGVSGGIAAYKTCTLVSHLKDRGANVYVIMTKEAVKLVSPHIFRSLSGNPTIIDLFDYRHITLPHIALSEMADILVIAPCTANVIGKIAQGIADDALTTVVLASTAKKLVAPAMNCNMWRNTVVQENVEKLKEMRFEFVGPEIGKLACGDIDIGRMSEPNSIIEKINEILSPTQDLRGLSILITAGGTREQIDPVRFISNRSSGKMGYTLAEAAVSRGAEVTLISGPCSLTPPEGVKTIMVESAQEMHDEVAVHREGKKAIIMAAAVADYRPSITFWQKLKKDSNNFTLELSKTSDILAELGRNKNGTFLVGFAAESNDHISNAKEKLEKKNLDIIVANDISAFEQDDSEATIINKSGKIETLTKFSKKEIAHRILDAILRL